MMNEEQLDAIYRKFEQTLQIRSEYIKWANGFSDEGTSYAHGYLLSALYHMMHDYPEIAEYIKRETAQMQLLNKLEGIPAVNAIAVPAESH